MNQVYMAPLTPVVKRLLIAMGVVWVVVQIILDKFMGLNLTHWFILHPDKVINSFWFWQTFTYMFFHALSPFHIFFNGLMLWFVGSELEKQWGAKFFTTYFFVCGIGAALVYCVGVTLYAIISGDQTPMIIPVMGASGGLFGLLVAYGIVYSERMIYFMGIVPLKAKYFVLIAAAIDMSSLLTSGFTGGEVAYLAHLGGAAVGFAFLWLRTRMKLRATKQKVKKGGASLRLVVDNEKTDKKGSGPKYWN
ncbi:MAG: rhomboid family intramembrane serine protease [Pseudobdellovibrio sp.]